MRVDRLSRLFAWFGVALAGIVPVASVAAPLGTSITYQGELRTNGQPAQGDHDFQVELYLEESGGSPIDTLTVSGAPVDAGLFSLQLDFTAIPFTVALQYWLELRVRGSASPGAFTTLTPRRPVTATPYAVHALTVAEGAVGALQIDPAQVQRRVGGTCANGISAIDANGAVTCSPGDVGATGIPWPSIVDIAFASAFSLTLAPDGLPLIAYVQYGTDDLRLIRCLVANCTQRVNTVVVDTGIVGPDISLVVDGRGLPVIGYYERSLGDAVIAICVDLACTARNTVVLDSEGDVGSSISIDIVGVEGRIAAAYYDRTNTNPKLAICSNVACSAREVIVVDGAPGEDGRLLSLVSTQGILAVAYGGNGGLQLKVSFCVFQGCTPTTRVVDTMPFPIQSIDTAMLTDGQPVIAYVRGGTTYYLSCGNVYCDRPTTPYPMPLTGSQRVAVSVGYDNLPLVASVDGPTFYRVRKCRASSDCRAETAWRFDALQPFDAIDMVTSPLDGLPRIAYINGNVLTLRVTGSPSGAYGGRMR